MTNILTSKVVFELYRGETLFIELEFFDDEDNALDLSAANPVAKASPAIDVSNILFDVTAAASGTITARFDGAYTADFPQGDHELQIWMEYQPGEDIEDEVVLDAIVHVKKRKVA